MGKKRKPLWTKAEREAREARIDEDLRRLREVAEKALADLEARRAQDATS